MGKFIQLNKILYKLKQHNNSNDDILSKKNIYLHNSLCEYNIYKNIIKQNLMKARYLNNKVIFNSINSNVIKMLDYNREYNNMLKFSSKNYNLFLNFKKNRFFPYFYNDNDKEIIFNNSLGIFSKK